MSARASLIIGLVLLAAGGLWAGVRASHALAPPADDDAAIGQPASGERPTLRFFRNPASVAAVSMRTIDGAAISSSDRRGKVTIVNFWATWCGPCRAEIPDLVALQKKYDKYLQIVGISQDEAPP